MLYVGDTGTLEIYLIDKYQNPLDLTDIKEAWLYIERGNKILKRECEIKEPKTSGIIIYKFSPEDLIIGDIDYTFQPVLIFNDDTQLTGSPDIEKVYVSLKSKAEEQ